MEFRKFYFFTFYLFVPFKIFVMYLFNFCYGICNKLWLIKLALLSSSQGGGKELGLRYTVIIRSKCDYVCEHQL